MHRAMARASWSYLILLRGNCVNEGCMMKKRCFSSTGHHFALILLVAIVSDAVRQPSAFIQHPSIHQFFLILFKPNEQNREIRFSESALPARPSAHRTRTAHVVNNSACNCPLRIGVDRANESKSNGSLSKYVGRASQRLRACILFLPAC